jgi:hypothetical protein
MPKIFWRSLRSRILLLVVLTIFFLAAAAISLFTFLRNRHAETLSLTEHHLVSVASNLARNYADHRTAANSLLMVEPGPPPPPPPPAAPPPPPRPQPDGPPHPRPDLLKEITTETLQHEDGIEGGFYAARADALIGYAFPTHEGPGPEKGMPDRERPTIENLAREPEQVVNLLRQIEVAVANGKTTAQACKEAEIVEQTYFRWRKEYGGLQIDQAKRLKELEQENGKLKRLVANLSLDNLVLKDIASGNF